MRLGVVGMLPPDFRAIAAEDLRAIRALGLSGAGFHLSGERLFEVQAADCDRLRESFAAAGMDLVQLGIGFGECLFDPDARVRARVGRKIERGIEAAREMGAQVCLIRPGSLSSGGSYSPCRRNHTPEARRRLLESLRAVAAKAEDEGVTVVVETHVLTIMDSPETCARIIAEVASQRLRVVMDYVNHFQALHQVYHSKARLEHIFEFMGPIAAVGHCKDIAVREGFVVHLDEEVPGEGELDLSTALGLWEAIHPEGYMLLEHLPDEQYPLASRNVHRIIAEAGLDLH